jgi:hypothetical protein
MVGVGDARRLGDIERPHHPPTPGVLGFDSADGRDYRWARERHRAGDT